jgi:hypothetical protein
MIAVNGRISNAKAYKGAGGLAVVEFDSSTENLVRPAVSLVAAPIAKPLYAA